MLKSFTDSHQGQQEDEQGQSMWANVCECVCIGKIKAQFGFGILSFFQLIEVQLLFLCSNSFIVTCKQ